MCPRTARTPSPSSDRPSWGRSAWGRRRPCCGSARPAGWWCCWWTAWARSCWPATPSWPRSSAPMAGQRLTAAFPTTTVTSLACLGTGLPPGEHGLPGYTSWVPEVGKVVSWLGWSPADSDDDLRRRLLPERLQPRPTIFERAAADGVEVTQCAPANFIGSGFTRAVLRGARFDGAASGGDVLAQAARAVRRGPRSLVYCYSGELDTVGHVRGPGSPAWCEQLRIVDAFAQRLHSLLPADATLLVTGRSRDGPGRRRAQGGRPPRASAHRRGAGDGGGAAGAAGARAPRCGRRRAGRVDGGTGGTDVGADGRRGGGGRALRPDGRPRDALEDR